MAAEDAVNDALTLVDFARKQRRAYCAVCQLPEEVRGQLRRASDRKISRVTVIAWLLEVQGISMTSDAMTTHYSGHHDS